MIRKILSIISSVSILSMTLGSISPAEKVLASSELSGEIVSMRSRYEKHFDNNDGTQTAFIDTSPIHYYENNEWLEIDNTIIKNDAGYFTNAGNSMNVILAPKASVEKLDELDDNHLFSLDYDKYSISWDIVELNNEEQKYERNTDSVIEISDSIPNLVIESDNDILNKALNNSSVSKISSVWYKSLYDGCDINIEVRPDSVKENTVINNRQAAENNFNYYIEADGLTAKLCEDNSIEYYDEKGYIVFNMPAPFMYEASNDNNKSYEIDVDLEEYGNGYILTYNPDKDWILSDERNYPVIIDPYVYINNNIYTYTLSEQYPTSYINNSQLKIGGEYGDRYSALISVPSSVLFSNDYVSITDAELYIYFNECTGTYLERELCVSAILSSYMPWWSGVNSRYLAEMNRFNLNTPGLNGVNVTKIVNSWQNYSRSGGKVGVYPYGVLVHQLYNYGAVYNADSASGVHSPYYIVTYKTDTTYTLTYNPYKYDDISSLDNNPNNEVYNFSKKMNCYAYALQIYDYGYVNGNQSHKLIPGELNISTSGSQFNNCTQLYNYYHSISNSSSFMNFVEQQMLYDSAVMGTNLQKINLSNNAQFVLPSGYNENSKRIIAMQTGYTATDENDFHFYLRHGNGTCSQHGGTCSIWSHKRGNNSISNTIGNTILCDSNIAQLAYNSSYTDGTRYDTRLRFYTLQQDTNSFNTKYSYNSSSDTTIYIN